MSTSKPDPASTTRKVLRDLGKATEKTQSGAPPERLDNVFLHKKGPYLG
jgi:hypothetical protein